MLRGVRLAEPALLYRVGECAAQGGDDPPDGGRPTPGGPEVGDELGDVPVPQGLQPQRAERGYQLLADVPLVHEPGLRLQAVPLPGDSLPQVVGHGFPIVTVTPVSCRLTTSARAWTCRPSR